MYGNIIFDAIVIKHVLCAQYKRTQNVWEERGGGEGGVGEWGARVFAAQVIISDGKIKLYLKRINLKP